VGPDWPAARARMGGDPADELAIVARAKRDLLLTVNSHRLRREDLEDCYSQATVELVAHVRKGGQFADRSHLSHALELRFNSRVRDRRRALAGRSPMQAALETASTLGAAGDGEVEIADGYAEVEKLVMLRDDLRGIGRVVGQLTADQRQVLGSQLSGESRDAFLRRAGWSTEKYRKVAQRARARLKGLMCLDQPSVPPAPRSSEKKPGPAYDYSPHS
jgi:hypothetical protein